MIEIDQVNILLVDDEEKIREKLSLWLNRKGYSVETAANGQEAIQKLQASDDNTHILISDLQMPEMNGIELIEACRRIQKNMGIIIITAHGDVDSYIETMNMGAFEYLNKPFELNDLHCVIKKLLSAKK